MVRRACASNRALSWSHWSRFALGPNHLICLAKTEAFSPEMFLDGTGAGLTPVPEAAPGRLNAPFDMTGSGPVAFQ